MSSTGIIAERLTPRGDEVALVWHDEPLSYFALSNRIEDVRADFERDGIGPGSVVAIIGDFSPNAIAAELALLELGVIVTPLRRGDEIRHDGLCEIARAEWVVSVDGEDRIAWRRRSATAEHRLLGQLRDEGQAGIILFSSGTSGVAKGALHDASRFLAKFDRPARPLSMLAFLLFDHVGGINTMLHSLLNGGSLVTPEDHSPDAVGAAIERHRAELLPTSPTFINMLMLSGAIDRYDLSSLQVISYGSEPMPESTLRALRERLPDVKLHQTYGMTELGIPVSKSRDSSSLWMKFNGDKCAYRVRDGMLEIQTESAMLGYLNAPSPFTEDGWFITGDAVEVDGDWFHVLSRRSELINVGGQKVVPVEVESVIEEMNGVEQAIVSPEPSVLTGEIVAARVRLKDKEDPGEFRRRLRRHCTGRLPRYMIPQKVVIVDLTLQSARHKKQRVAAAPFSVEQWERSSNDTGS